MKVSDVTLWDVAKYQYQRTPIRMLGVIGLLLSFFGFIIYAFISHAVSHAMFMQWVREQTEGVIRNPEVAGITVEKFESSDSYRPVSAIYSFETLQDMLQGAYQLCEKYEDLGWIRQHSETCRDLIDNEPHKRFDYMIWQCEKYRWLRINPPHSEKCKDLAVIKKAIENSNLTFEGISNPTLDSIFSILDVSFRFCLSENARLSIYRSRGLDGDPYRWSLNISVRTSISGIPVCDKDSMYSFTEKLDTDDENRNLTK